MSNFTKKDLYQILGDNRKSFEELSEIAQKKDVFLRLSIDPYGNIILRSERITVENGKFIVRKHKIAQGNGYVSESSRTEREDL